VFASLLPELSLTFGSTTIDSFWIGSVLVIVPTGLYTAIGGMRAVAYNDTVQVVVLIIGSALLTFYGLFELGGWHELRRIVGSDMFNLWKPLVPAGMEGTWAPVKEPTRIAWYFNDRFPWLGMAICAPIIGLWYWCTDQYIVQRALGAPNETVARRGSIFAAFLKLFPPYLFIIPGLIAFALAKSGRNAGLADAFFGPNASPTAMQGAFPLMVEHLLPSGLRGIVVAGLLSALMGSLAGVFNACSTLFTVDLYQKWRPNATERDLVRTGRIATVIMVLIAMAWIPVIKGAHGLYNYLQAVQGYLAPPIFVVFFFGVFNKRLNALGCLWALIVGFVIGVFRLIVDTPVSLKLAGYENGYTYGGFLWIVNNIYFQYYSVLITVISIIVLIVVSYATAAPPEEKLAGLTYATITPEQRRQSRESWSTIDLVGSAVVVCAIIGAYLYFNG